MWNFHPPTPPLEQSTPLLNRDSAPILLESFVRHLRILLAWLSLGHDSDTMLDEHDSPHWYDIVHFEHKLSWLCFGLPQKAGVKNLYGA